MMSLKHKCMQTINNNYTLFGTNKLKRSMPTHLLVEFLTSMKPDKICDIACNDEELALFVLKNRKTVKALGYYDLEAIHWMHDHACYGYSHLPDKYNKYIHGIYLYNVCKSFYSTIKFCNENKDVFKNLLSAIQMEILTETYKNNEFLEREYLEKKFSY